MLAVAMAVFATTSFIIFMAGMAITAGQVCAYGLV
jgi:hypothetical protein